MKTINNKKEIIDPYEPEMPPGGCVIMLCAVAMVIGFIAIVIGVLL